MRPVAAAWLANAAPAAGPRPTYSVIAARVLDPVWTADAPPQSIGTPFEIASGTLPAGGTFAHSALVPLTLPSGLTQFVSYWYGAVYTPPGGSAVVAFGGTTAPPMQSESAFVFGTVQAAGVSVEGRTGGLESDPLLGGP